MPTPNGGVLELRVVVTTQDYARLAKFYLEGLGIEAAAVFHNGGGNGLLLEMGRATLEVFDEAQAEAIDEIEAGQRLSGQIRFALQVPDLQSAVDRLIANGATLVHEPVTPPWGGHNARLQDPDGMQITLFEAE
jgi:methylmalonyl-CoA/ethylmalonyl-CoA epimerase